jgi:hypothetical protein
MKRSQILIVAASAVALALLTTVQANGPTIPVTAVETIGMTVSEMDRAVVALVTLSPTPVVPW